MESNITRGVQTVGRSRLKYQYEALGDHEFQLLVNAVLAHQFAELGPHLRDSSVAMDVPEAFVVPI